MFCEVMKILQIDSTQYTCNQFSVNEKCRFEHYCIAFFIFNFTLQLYLTTLHVKWKKKR